MTDTSFLPRPHHLLCSPSIKEPPLTRELNQRIKALQGDPDFMTSLARGLLVLSVFTYHTRTVTMSQVSLETGISRAAVRRVLYTLVRLGYVGEQGRAYMLLPRVLAIGNAYAASSPMTLAAQPVLEALSNQLQASCSLSVLDGDEVLYIARAETVRITSICLKPGSRLPAYCTSMGRMLLAGLPQHTLEAYLNRTLLRPRTEHTITQRSELVKRLLHISREGTAVVDQEWEIGLRSIAVPVHNRRGEIVAALNASTQVERVSLQCLQGPVLTALRDAAKHLSTLLE
ncbi:helix-turn-helix domain-containing protein [Xylella taiwanensis]|uniref:IclR family transcriptional regulator n=2 Tax=Xylella taiwanensis TaxID=1444770 RepID=Z9JMV8_9GAMM|nr:IclR family transcriptional regulator [Xylella taiwanensis]NBI36792.1 helix-turn-helix domain-containing protein [Xylella taiwanensis]QKD98298.1 helix-turn-helix domain-containing protein [Xylella taiwanensis]